MKKAPVLLVACLLFLAFTAGLLLRSTVDSAITTFKSPGSPAATVQSPSSECLSPISTFAYQLGEAPDNFDWSLVNEAVLPPAEWEQVAHIPGGTMLQLIRSRSTHETEFWIRTNETHLILYRLNDSQPASGAILKGPEARNESYFLDSRDNVWSARYFTASSPLLSRYNEQTNQWDTVEINFPHQDDLGFITAGVDDQGTIWLVGVRGIGETKVELYSINLSTMAAERHLGQNDLYPPAWIAHNTILLFAKSDGSKGNVFITYSTDDGSVVIHEARAPIYGNYQRTQNNLPNHLFVDNKQRIWFGGRAWFNLQNKQWQFIIPDPVFITVLGGAGEWRWDEPKITAETSDGRLWYNSLRGMGWVNPDSGKWCVFTNYQGNILSDTSGKIWMLAGEYLYRLK